MLSSVQRRMILKEAGFLPYLGGKNPSNPITPEPLTAGSMGQGSGSDFPPRDDYNPVDQGDVIDKIIEAMKLLQIDNMSEDEIRSEAIKILKSFGL